MQDVQSAIVEWKKDGDQVIVMGDLNEYINSNSIKIFFDRLDMQELIIERHGENGPATTRSNKSNEAVDGMMGTLGLKIIAGGYLPFHHRVKSDHRLIWAKLLMTQVFNCPPYR